MKMRIPGMAFVLILAAGPAPLRAENDEPPAFDPVLFQGMEWRSIGPFRGGRSVAVAGVASDPRTYYFGAVGGGVWKTENAGETWTNVSDGQLRTSSVGAIAVAPSDPNVVYVGMGEHAIRGVMTSHGDGVYRSTDAGKTWKHVGLENTRSIARIRIHPRDPDLVYVAAQGAPYGPSEDRGIYRSRDGGKSWEKILYVSETAGASDLAMDPTHPRILYASFWDHLRKPWEVRSGGPGSGIHKSTDGGDTWEKIGEGLPEEIGKIGLDVSPDPDRVYAIVEADPGGGLFRSDDGGKSWNLTSEDWALRGRAWYYMEVYADPTNENVVWVLNAPVMRSIDGGKTFTRVRTPHGDSHDLWINPHHGGVLIEANDGGANISFDGGQTWSTQRNQPTAQFYRVNADERFPYYVYGGQQDNTTVAIASRDRDGRIDEKDWYAVGGCESGYVAFDPKDPSLVYAGCYMGQISEWDARTGNVRNAMAYPTLPAAIPPREMRYRFNWNAPILVSQHDPGVLYHAAQMVLKTGNRGLTWREVSPDLTRNDPEKQGPGGRPITNEGAGGEIYNTVFYLAESPHDAGTLWAGSDDGLVHLTRDGGASWNEVTPGDLGESQVNAIEVSPHDPATAYFTATRYKFNDFTPLAYKTTDFGKTWRKIVNGFAQDDWVRVVREDPVRRGLLYAGTETGVYVSFDGGERWQSLQLNLPVTPITDLKAHRNDLIAATGGRSFWILDDLSPLRQLDAPVATSRLHLFRPAAAHRLYVSRGFGGEDPRAGKNPPDGAIIDYYLAEAPEGPIELEIRDAAGRVVRTYTSEKKEDSDERQGAGGAQEPLPAKKGMSRVSWDLRHDPVPEVPGLHTFGTLRGGKVVPGTYEVRLRAGEEARTAPLEVLPDPRVSAPAEAYREQAELLAAVTAELSAIHEAVVRLRDVRTQVESLVERAGDHANGAGVAELGRKLVEELNEVEDALIQKRTVDGQTVINFPTRLNQNYIYLRSAIDSAEAGVSAGARERFEDLSEDWRRHRSTVDRLLGEELAALNARVREAALPAIAVPEKP